MVTELGTMNIRVEGPDPRDVGFYGKWFLAAAELEALWSEACRSGPFRQRVRRLLEMYIPSFAITAYELYSSLQPDSPGFVLSLQDAIANEFAVMAELGFITRDGHLFRLALPPRLNLDMITAAALKYADTMDERYWLHPESILRALTDGCGAP